MQIQTSTYAKLVINAKKKKGKKVVLSIGKAFQPQHFDHKNNATQKLLKELKKQLAQAKYYEREARRETKKYGAKTKLALLASSKHIKHMAASLEVQWKLRQLKLKGLTQQIRKAGEYGELDNYMRLTIQRKKLMMEKNECEDAYSTLIAEAERLQKEAERAEN